MPLGGVGAAVGVGVGVGMAVGVGEALGDGDGVAPSSETRVATIPRAADPKPSTVTSSPTGNADGVFVDDDSTTIVVAELPLRPRENPSAFDASIRPLTEIGAGRACHTATYPARSGRSPRPTTCAYVPARTRPRTTVCEESSTAMRPSRVRRMNRCDCTSCTRPCSETSLAACVTAALTGRSTAGAPGMPFRTPHATSNHAATRQATTGTARGILIL